jgi:hypothetical protein
MKCATPLLTYTCNSGSGTTCTKVTVTIPAINANTTCLSTDLVVMTGAEYTTVTGNAATAVTTANAASASVAAGVNVHVLPYEATPDDYLAISTIFGAFLVAACVIWGAKYVYAIFHNRPEA